MCKNLQRINNAQEHAKIAPDTSMHHMLHNPVQTVNKSSALTQKTPQKAAEISHFSRL